MCFPILLEKMGTKTGLSHKAHGTKLPRRNSEPPKQPPFFISAPFRPTPRSPRWKCAACARIPAASPRRTKARRSCFPYGARPRSCKIINPMAARAALRLPSRARKAACHHLSACHTRSVKSGIFKQARVLQSSAETNASKPPVSPRATYVRRAVRSNAEGGGEKAVYMPANCTLMPRKSE